MKNGHGIKFLEINRKAAAIAAFFCLGAALCVHGADRYFVGSGNWNETARWSDTSGGSGGFSVPGGNDTAIFDDNSGDCVINANASVKGMLLAADYTGAITQGGNYDMIVYDGNFTQLGGAFTAPAGTLTVYGTITITGGTFDANGGTVIKSGNAGTLLNAPGVNFNNLNFYANGNRQYFVTNHCQVAGNIRVSAGNPGWDTKIDPQGSALITLQGNFAKTNSRPDYFYSFAVPMKLIGSNDQTINGWDSPMDSHLTVDKPAGLVITGGSATPQGGVTLLNGTLIDGTPAVNRGAMIVTNSASYILTNCASASFSEVRLYDKASFAAHGEMQITQTLQGKGFIITNEASVMLEKGNLQVLFLQNYGQLDLGESGFTITDADYSTIPCHFGNIEFNDFTFRSRGNRTMKLDEDLVIRGNLRLDNNNPGWETTVSPPQPVTVTLYGNFVQTNCNNNSTFGNSSLTLVLAGTNEQTLACHSGKVAALLKAATNANVRLDTDFKADSLAISNGASFNLNGCDLTLSAKSLIVEGTLAMQGDEALPGTTPTLNTGSTVEYRGADAPVTVSNWPYKNLAVNAPGRQLNWTAGASYTIAESWRGGGASAAQRVVFRSTEPGTLWNVALAPSATQDLRYVDVSDSDASGGQTIYPYVSVGPDAHNFNWRFHSGTVMIIN